MFLCVFVYSIASEKRNKLDIKNDNNEAQNTTYPLIFANFVHMFRGTGIKQNQISQQIQYNRGKQIKASITLILLFTVLFRWYFEIICYDIQLQLSKCINRRRYCVSVVRRHETKSVMTLRDLWSYDVSNSA